EAALAPAVPIERATDMDDAVRVARGLARPGDVVLLAPACASFDMFRSYAHRGDEFARAVRELAEKEAPGSAASHRSSAARRVRARAATRRSSGPPTRSSPARSSRWSRSVS